MDEVVDLAAEIGDVVISRVDEVRPHPNADRLRVCTVDAGTGTPLQVVCGAPNVVAGGFYPFAPVGSLLPGGVAIKKAKLRGEASEGMLCSARELGLGRDHAGLMTLQGDWKVGARFVDELGLDDARLVVDVTPNRSELLSHVGIARELAAGGVDGVSLPAFPAGRSVELQLDSDTAEGIGVVLESDALCSRFTGAVVRGVTVRPSPEWLATRLRAIGVRPINNVVDATNYVLMELGQPLHAYDRAKLRGGEIRVRSARDGETLRTLDGIERVLLGGDLVIADAERVVGLGGVMGGEDTEVGEDTTELFVECAHFDPGAVRRTSRRLGLSTDASYRFERGVDSEGQPAALRRVVELILAVAGGEVGGGVDVEPVPFERPVVELRPERIRQILGVPLTGEEATDLLRPLGFVVEDASAAPLRVSVPGYRPDVVGEIDLVEEIARRRGYDSFPDEIRPFRPTEVPQDPTVAVERQVRDLFVAHGFLEARLPAFAPESAGSVALLNPLSAEEGHLRTSLASGLLRRLEHNFAHGVRDVRLFTLGTVFSDAGEGLPHEENRLAAVFTGARQPLHWSAPTEVVDVWDAKALFESLASAFEGGAVQSDAGELLAPHLSSSVRFGIVSNGVEVGGGGLAAPGALDAPAWAGEVWIVEARLPSAAREARATRYAPLPVHPAMERDLALLVPASIAAAELNERIREASGSLLEDAAPFDLYEGKGIPEGIRSIAWRLRLRATDRTLTDKEADAVVGRVLRALEAIGVQRR